MLEDLQKNIDSEIEMVKELASFIQRYEEAHTSEEQRIFLQAINSLKKRIRFVNNSVYELAHKLSLTQKLPGAQAQKKEGFQTVSQGSGRPDVIIKVKDRGAFLKELNISETIIKRLRKKKLVHKKKKPEFQKTSAYAKLANKFFLNMAETWIKRGTFKKLSFDLRRSNLNILTATYVSMMFLSLFISLFAGILLYIFLIFFSVGLAFPFITPFDGNYILRLFQVIWAIPLVPIIIGISFYLFPGAEKRALSKRIDQELPFVVIHMASVSGSGIEPGEIFRIIGTSKEYTHTKKEIAKILNQTNIYGYDLTNALRNVAHATPSTKLAELLNGISITINSGGDIKSFFEKRAESLLLEYRLEREKFTKTAETFMDIYISIVIAAPMILLMLLIMISVSGIQTGFSVNQMTLAIIGIVAIINVLFLTFMHFKQPTY